MAVIRYQQIGDNTVNYVATLAFFFTVSCVTLMLKFGRFKTNFNVYNGNKRKSGSKHYDEFTNVSSINGAYRTNRDEFFVYNNNSEPQQKPKAPVPPPAPAAQPPTSIRQTKSTNDLIKEQNLPPNLRGAQSGVSLDPRGADTENSNSRTQAVDPKKNKQQLDAQKKVEKQRLEEQKKLEKQRQQEQKKLEKQRSEKQKKRQKLALQEKAKQEKLRKEREKKEAQQAKKTKKTAPQKPLANPSAQSSTQAGNSSRSQPSAPQYSTNTLESSISKTSGPPPYAEVPTKERKVNENNSNVSYSEPEDTGSWDMISQHRHNVSINRPVNPALSTKGKVTTMDLNYTLGKETIKENSEA